MSPPLIIGRRPPEEMEGGFAMAGVLLLGLALAAVMALIATRTSALFDSSARDRGWEEAVYVAESGLDTALSQITADPSYSTVAAGTDLSSRDQIIAAATQLAADPANLVLTPDGQFVIVRAPGSSLVYGVGATPSWVAAERQLRVVEATVSTTTAAGCWPDAAIVGLNYVEIGSSSTISTIPSIRHTASVYSNGNYKGTSGTYVDGDIRVGGTISGTTQANLHGVMETGATPWAFPTSADLTNWENQLKAQAQAGTQRAGIDLSTTMTLTAPAYISGDVFLRSGGRLTINGSGVVYVTGRMEMGGDSVLTNGALLAVHGQFKQGGGTQYLLGAPASSAGLISFLVDKDAIIFEGAATGSQGVIYAARGGVKLTDSAALQGAAVAGGDGTAGQVKAGGGTTVSYPAGLLPSATWLPAIGGGPLAACSSSDPAWFGNGAILSNGNVTLSGGAYTYSDPAGSHEADVRLNGTYKDATSQVDGSIVAGGTVTVNPLNVAGTVTAGAGQVVTFPPADAIAAWRASLVAAAQVGGIYPAASYGTDVTLSTPRYINGNFTVSGGKTLTLTGGGVFYVAGTLTMSGGGTVYNSGIIAADGKVVISGGGGYNCTATNPAAGGLFSFSTDKTKAIELSGGSGAPLHGVAYAVYGGLTLSGGSNWNGMLMAGGEGGVTATFSGGSRITYPAGFFGTVTSLPVPPPRPPTSRTVVTLTDRREL